MKFTLPYDVSCFITSAHKAYGWKFTKYLRMWKCYHSIHDGAKL